MGHKFDLSLMVIFGTDYLIFSDCIRPSIRSLIHQDSLLQERMFLYYIMKNYLTSKAFVSKNNSYCVEVLNILSSFNLK